MKKSFAIFALAFAALSSACVGERVEVPPAHIGKIMTPNGYQEGTIPSSNFRLAYCPMWAACQKLILLNVSDQARREPIQVFMPEDKLNMDVQIQVTLSLDPTKTESLFTSLSPTNLDGRIGSIDWDTIYKTYAQQIVLSQSREYLSKFSIAQVASNLEKVNSDLREVLTQAINSRSPFTVRYVGLTNIEYPKIITDAQENAAQRREAIQQEEAQLQISKVKLERELQEARLQRQIDIEKAQAEAAAQKIQREVIDEKVLELRRIENEAAKIAKWNGSVPQFIMGDDASNMMLMLPSAR